MQNSMKLYVMILTCGVFLAGGCAKQEVVKKDESIAPMPVAKPLESPKASITAPAYQKQQAAVSVDRFVPVQQVQKTSSASQLQSSLNRIYFNFDSSDLSDTARTTLKNNATALLKDTTAMIRIEGNCDERGSAEYNLALGERRAQAAKRYLATMGVADERLSTISYGKERPVEQRHDENAWKVNRRDEFVVVKQ